MLIEKYLDFWCIGLCTRDGIGRHSNLNSAGSIHQTYRDSGRASLNAPSCICDGQLCTSCRSLSNVGLPQYLLCSGHGKPFDRNRALRPCLGGRRFCCPSRKSICPSSPCTPC